MHRHLIKYLSEIIKKRKEKGVPHMLAHRRCYLDYSKVHRDVTERWLLAWNQKIPITYYIFYLLIANSVFIFLTIACICDQQISIIRCY